MRERDEDKHSTRSAAIPAGIPFGFILSMHQPSNGTEVTPEETFEGDSIKGTYDDDSQE